MKKLLSILFLLISINTFAQKDTIVIKLPASKNSKVDTTTAITGLTTKYQSSLKANDNAVVHLAGTEFIPGAKTFGSSLAIFDTTAASSNINITSQLPSIIQNLVRSFGGGYAYSLFKGYAGLTSSTLSKTLDYGIYGQLPSTVNYAYLGVGSDATFTNNNLRLYPDKTIGLMTVNDAVGDFVTRNSSSGLVTIRTAVETLGDIGGAPSLTTYAKVQTDSLFALTHNASNITSGRVDTSHLPAVVISTVYPIVYDSVAQKLKLNQSYLDSSASSASYTPTLTATTNSSTPVLNNAYYTKIGNIITVSVNGSITVTTGSTMTEVSVSLPFTSKTYTAGSWLGQGAIGINSGTSIAVAQVTYVNTTTFKLRYTSASATSDNFSVTFTYNQ